MFLEIRKGIFLKLKRYKYKSNTSTGIVYTFCIQNIYILYKRVWAKKVNVI